MAKKSAAHTGPVMTLLDLVVHVPVNCGSVCPNTKDPSTTPAARDDRSSTIMKYWRWKVSREGVKTGKKGKRRLNLRTIDLPVKTKGGLSLNFIRVSHILEYYRNRNYRLPPLFIVYHSSHLI